MTQSIRSLLANLNLIDENVLEVFSIGTRDKSDIKVMRDPNSGVIFLDEFVPNDSVYERGAYRSDGLALYGKRDYEITVDVHRRLNDYKQFYVGKKILDFGCGEGSFLKGAQDSSEEVIGVEIEKSYFQNLNQDGIQCVRNLSELGSKTFDTVFCFHTLEHLKDPIEILTSFSPTLNNNGNLVVEVPHANDFLLQNLKSEAFKKFTLWSQHLILHTRVSFKRFLMEAGFKNFTIQGKQRYKLSNHLNWLSFSEPGGHKGLLSSIDTDRLTKAYEESLQMIDATDTLVAVVSVD